jgi:hypothetical protein
MFSASDVASIVFVMTPRDLVDSGIQGFGIQNLFICCQKMEVCDKQSNISNLQMEELPTFPSQHERHLLLHNSCTGRLFFNGIVLLQDMFKGCLHRFGEKQGDVDCASAKGYLHPDVWNFFKSTLLLDAPSIYVKSARAFTPKGAIHHGCFLHTQRVPKEITRIRLWSRQHFRALQRILGTAICFGMRVRRPKVADRLRRVNENDSFNVVRACDDVSLLPNNMSRSTEFGIDLLYDEHGHSLSLCVRYKKWVFTTTVLKRPANCPLGALETMLTFGHGDDDKNNNNNNNNNSNKIGICLHHMEERIHSCSLR